MAIVASMSSPEIDSKLRELLGAERNTKVDFLLHLDAFDRVDGYAKLGYASLWDYLARELGLLGCAIFFRTQSMLLLRRFPQIEDYLRDGRLCMTSLVKLKDAITVENVEDILARCAEKSVHDVETIVASLRPPLPDAPTKIRKVPLAKARELGLPLPVERDGDADAKPTVDVLIPARASKAKAQPIAEDTVQVTMRVRRSFVEKSERVKAIYSHRVPNGDLAAIFEAMMDDVLARDEKKHAPRKPPRPRISREKARIHSRESEESISGMGSEASTEAPVAGQATAAGDTRNDDGISASVRAEVFTRDDGGCQWPLANGEKCGRTHQLELDHKISRAKGGPSTALNLWMLCRAHNLMKARQEFGRKFMEKFRQKERPTSIDRSRP